MIHCSCHYASEVTTHCPSQCNSCRILIVNICHDRDHESRAKTARAAKCNTLLGCGDYSFVGKTTIIRKQILTKYHEKVLKKFVLCNRIGFFQEDFKTVTMVFYKDHHKKNLKYSKKTQKDLLSFRTFGRDTTETGANYKTVDSQNAVHQG